MQKAVEAGINFFDTADIYSRGQSEEILGRALKEPEGAPRRERDRHQGVQPDGPRPEPGRPLDASTSCQSIDASLTSGSGSTTSTSTRSTASTIATPIEETIEALDDVVKSGKALYIGASSMFAYQFSKYLHRADQLGRTRFAMMQNHYNLLYREEEREMNPLCLEEGVGLIPWSPLAGGVLAGSREAGTMRSQSAMGRDRYNRPADQAVLAALKAGRARGEAPAQVAIAWMLSKPAVTAPIVGATKAAAPRRSADGRRESAVSAEEIAELEAPYEPQAVIGALGPNDIPMREIRAASQPRVEAA